jgi:hypothetical protein
MMTAAAAPIAIPTIALEGKPVLVEGMGIEDEEVVVEEAVAEEAAVGRLLVGDELGVVVAIAVYRNGRISENVKNRLS